MKPNTEQILARYLRHGDVTAGSGETIVNVSAGVRTPRGKVDVVLAKNGRQRVAQWGASTMVAVVRP